MEKTDRKSIEHKIKVTHPTNLPDIPKLSKASADKIKTYLKGPKPKDQLQRITAIYELVDIVIQEMEPVTVCRKGCAWCCAIPLEIMPIEITYIENKTGLKRKSIDYTNIAGQEHNVGYCPMLDQATACCRIYEYRPFNCRAFVVFDSPEYCKRGYNGENISHWTNGGPEHGYGNDALLHLSLDIIKTELNIQRPLELTDKDILEKRVKDIRCYFK